MTVLGFDTSNYTTSAARFDGRGGVNCSRLLDVKPGTLGLRQSEALFAHVQRLPALVRELMEDFQGEIRAIGVSTRPREAEGSYMPCFLAGASQAETLGAVLRVPVRRFSHQQGHLAAALWSAGRLELMDRPFLAWHLSGGTTELLRVEPSERTLTARRIGGSADLSAGQLIDRTGKLLGLPFPAGKTLDALGAGAGEGTEKGFPVKCPELEFSLSGVENQVRARFDRGAPPKAVAAYALRSILTAVRKATEHALRAEPGLPVVFSGGVSSNTLLRREMPDAVFCPPQYATDNAMGPAILAWREENG